MRRKGVSYGLWTFMIKVRGALAGLSVGVFLGLFGYVPDVAQSTSSLLGIRLLVGPVTALFFILGIVFLHFYPIDRAQYEQIRKKISALEGKRTEPVSGPVS